MPENLVTLTQLALPVRALFTGLLGDVSKTIRTPEVQTVLGAASSRTGTMLSFDGAGAAVASNVQRELPFFAGSIWRASNQLFRNTTEQHIGDARGVLSINNDCVGSGALGPANADYGMFIRVQKAGGFASAAIGEINGTYTLVNQVGAGDVSGHLTAVSIVGNSGGGALAHEMSTSRLNTSGATTHKAQAWMAHSEAFEPDFGQVYDGEARVGTIKDCYLTDTYNESAGTAGAAPSFTWAFRVRSVRSDANQTFGVSGSGRVQFGPSTNSISLNYNTANSLFSFLSTGQSTALVSMDQSGNLFTGARVNDVQGNVRGLPSEYPTTARTIAAADRFKTMRIGLAGVTLQAGGWLLDDWVGVYHTSVGGVARTITAGAGVTLNWASNGTTGSRTIAPFGRCTIECIGTDSFVIYGDGLS